MLSRFLGIERGDVVSFVGGGGKTSLMLALARELAQEHRVVVTTTTKMGAGELEGFDIALSMDELQAKQSGGNPVVLISEYRERKVIGVSPETVDGLQGLADIVLVEADGSRRMPVKAPKETEPVIPGSNTKTVIVFGFQGMDQPVGKAAYDAEGISKKIPGISEDAIIDPPLLRRIMLRGGFLDKITRGRIYIVINQAELDQDRAREFAGELFHPRLFSIATASAKDGWIHRVNNEPRDIVPVILAAGRSSRFNGNKLLEPFEGKPIIEHVLEAVRDSGFIKPILVVGHQADQVQEAVSEYGLTVVGNPDFDSGMASSLKLGVQAAGDCGAVLVLLADMPGVTPQLIKTVINAYMDSCAWAARPHFGQKPGHPVVIGRELFPAVMGLIGDTGARQVLGANSNRVLGLKVDPATQADIDTRDDLSRLKGE